METQTSPTTPKVNGVDAMAAKFAQTKAEIDARKAKEIDYQAEIERLKAENEALKKGNKSTGNLSLKVSEKGAVSVYGMGRFPVTLYAEQWEKLLATSDQITAFLKANAAFLIHKS